MTDYTLDELEAGVRAAMGKGDTETAKKLGAEYVRLEAEGKHDATEYAPAKESILEKGVKFLTGASQAKREIGGAVAEPILQQATGMIAKPISEIAGLAATGYEMATGGEGAQNIPGFQRELQEKLTYQPKTEAGKSAYNPLTAIPMALGKAIGLVTPEKAAESEALTLGGMARNIASEAVPQAIGLAGMKTAPKAAIPAQKAAESLRAGAERLMKSSLKPTAKDLLNGKAAKAIDTMLEKGIPATPKGIEQVRAQIDVLNEQIRDVIANSPERVETQKLVRPIVEKLKYFREQANPNADISAIKSSWNEFKNHLLLQHETPEKIIPAKVDPYTGVTTPEKVIPASGKEDMSIQVAQALKQGTYKQLAKKYGQLGSADVEAQKAIARGLKEQVAKQAPEVVPLNLEESKLLNVLSVAERRIVMEANKNPMGLALLTKDPKAWAAFMADRSATAKSLLARIMNRASKRMSGAASSGTAQKAMETASAMAPSQTDKERQPKPLAEAFQ
jgi:hypothetical protein